LSPRKTYSGDEYTGIPVTDEIISEFIKLSGKKARCLSTLYTRMNCVKINKGILRVMG